VIDLAILALEFALSFRLASYFNESVGIVRETAVALARGNRLGGSSASIQADRAVRAHLGTRDLRRQRGSRSSDAARFTVERRGDE
jgi:hypothetical protein